MSESSPVSIDSVRALVAERQRFDQWLSALEARRAETPAHVYDRVHADYAGRRHAVLDQLHEHAPALAALLGELDERAALLSSQVQAQEDERAEAMLRHAVGEFDDAAWDAVRGRVEEALSGLQDARDGVDAQRDELRDLLAEARPVPELHEEVRGAGDEATAPAAPSGLADTARDGWRTDADAHVTATDTDAATIPAATGRGGMPGAATSEASEAVLSAEAPVDVDPWRTARDESSAGVEPGVSALARTEDEAPGRAATVTETLAAIDAEVLDPSESAAEDAPRPPMAAAQRFWGTTPSAPPFASPSPAADAPPASSGALEGATTSGGAPDAGATSPPADAFDDLAFLRSVIDPGAVAASSMAPKAPGMGEPQKTLRCTECSTMNLPTEWYCERCGGELASF